MNIKEIQKQKGFSLTEVVISILILGILASMSLVSLNRSTNNEKLKLTTRSLENWINQQRNIAMQTGHSCSILINPSTTKITSQRAFLSSPTGCSSIAQMPSVFDFKELYGADFNKLTVTVTPTPSMAGAKSGVTFSYRGFSENLNLASNEQLIIRLSSPDVTKQRCIKVVSPIGLIRDGYASNATSDCTFDGAF